MWIGIVVALLLCLATAVCYAEMAKLYPGTGSSYYFAEQSFLNHDKAWRYARLSKFIVGWGSHLYYWIYPGVMVGVMGVLCGYLVGERFGRTFMSASNPGPAFMMVVAVVFSFGVAYIANRGVNGSTSVNIAINVIQISALVVFSVMALGYRMNHPPGSVAYPVRFDFGRCLHLRVRDRKDDGGRRIDRHGRARCGWRSQAEAGCGRKARAVPDRLSREGREGWLLESPRWRFRRRSAQLRLGVRAGHGRHSDSGGI